MASIRFHKDRKQWEIRKRVTNKRTREVHFLNRLLPKGASSADAHRMAAKFDDLAFQMKMGTLTTFDPLPETVEKWLKIVATHTERTLDHYQRTISKFVGDLPPGVMAALDISAIHIQNFLEAVLERTTAQTANRQLTVIKSFCRWFSRLYDLPNPADKVYYLSEEPPKRRFLTPEEYEKILADCTDDARDMFQFLANTGLRASEFCGLKWVDIESDFLSLSIIGKGRKRRAIPLNEICRDILQRRLVDKEKSEFVFLTNSSSPRWLKFNGRPMDRRNLYEMCAVVSRRLGIPAFGPHAFRHFFATQLLVRGLPIIKTSMILGHARTQMTMQVYSHILPGDLLGATDILLDENKDAYKKAAEDVEQTEPAGDIQTSLNKLKENNDTGLLMISQGDHFESYLADAERIHNVVGLPLQHRKRDEMDILFCSIPRFGLKLILNRLMADGASIAVMDSIGGRDITKIYRPGSAA